MIIGQFFLIYPPGLEDLGKAEILFKKSLIPSWDQIEILEVTPGGIEIGAPMELIRDLNQLLKGPVRILQRIHHFKCSDFPKLYLKTSKIKWNQYTLGKAPKINCSSHQSRLFDSRKIEKAVIDGINQFFIKQPPKKKYLELAEKNIENIPEIYVRMINDFCTISIDTSGEALYKRNSKAFMGHAPIRENIASLLLTLPLTSYSDSFENILDPMCGSGTFLTESSQFLSFNTTRKYAYELIPIYMENNSWPVPQKLNQKNYKLLGQDIDQKLILTLKKNKELEMINLSALDFFSMSRIDQSTFIIVNPPYGIRVGDNIDTLFFDNFIKKIEHLMPNLFGIIIPFNYPIKKLVHYQLINKWNFKNGGLEVSYYLFSKK